MHADIIDAFFYFFSLDMTQLVSSKWDIATFIRWLQQHNAYYVPPEWAFIDFAGKSSIFQKRSSFFGQIMLKLIGFTNYAIF